MTDEGLPADRLNRILTAVETIEQSLGVLARKQQINREDYKNDSDTRDIVERRFVKMTEAAIDIDEFENAGADEFEEQSDTERIVLFLDKYNNRAWKAATIAEQLGLDTDAVSAILSRLKDRGLVRHKRPYWAISVDRGHRRHSGVAV
ncbi:MAG: hypothetical protein J07HQW2_02199 [Haloquadratum walsbyi J07HQW2]|jgi:hypothetical protein|uniref:MarR family transcriptional regulator n=2 Tax=Haloquadratum walsbyi TaxID=293091 RepID=U1MYZ5_9EURY|nr:MAG: hypothetical protein J07HQW2_02199 [Haloquadratum walsbyi J07HQW2]